MKEERETMTITSADVGELKLAKIESEYTALAQPIGATIEALRANLGSGGITQFDLSRVKVPTGGGTTWEVPELEGSTPSKAIEGIIVGWRDVRAYWEHSFSGAQPPDCSSQDAVTGIGNPGGSCNVCPMAEFGSKVGDDGKPRAGQACKLMRLLFILRKDDLLPLVLTAPPTSIPIIKRYFLQLASRGLPYWSVGTKFGLEKTRSGDGIEFSRIMPAIGARLTPEEDAKAREYSAFFGSMAVSAAEFVEN